MGDPLNEPSPQPADPPALPPALPDEYPLATPPEKAAPPPLPSWLEKRLVSMEEKQRWKHAIEPPLRYPPRELILLSTGLTGFMGLVCLRLGLRGLALGIIVLGILFLGWLVVLAVLRRRLDAAEQSPADGAIDKKPDFSPPQEPPAAPPFQFTLADLMITVTAMICLMSLTSLLPGGSKLSYIAGISGAGVFLGLIVISTADSVHRLVRLAWIMLLITYVFSSLAAIFLEVQ